MTLMRPGLVFPTDRPLLLLDIDGVINVRQCPEAREVRISPHLPSLLLLPGIEEALLKLDAALALVWCSYWEAVVKADLGELWGIGPRPALTLMTEGENLRDGKFRGVQRAVGDWRGPLVWIEDGFHDRAYAWAAARVQDGSPTWLLDVTENGLTMDLVQTVLDWAAELREQPG